MSAVIEQLRITNVLRSYDEIYIRDQAVAWNSRTISQPPMSTSVDAPSLTSISAGKVSRSASKKRTHQDDLTMSDTQQHVDTGNGKKRQKPRKSVPDGSVIINDIDKN